MSKLFSRAHVMTIICKSQKNIFPARAKEFILMRWHPCHLIQLSDDVEALLNLSEEVSVFVGYKTVAESPFLRSRLHWPSQLAV